MRWNVRVAATLFVMFVVIVAVTVFLLGSASAAKPMTIKQAATQYLRDVGHANKAGNAFIVSLKRWDNEANSIPAQTQPFVNAYANQMTTFYRELLVQHWPARASKDVRTLARDVATFGGDVESLPAVNIFGVSQWVSIFQRDENIMAVQADIVRRDLGLRMAKA